MWGKVNRKCLSLPRLYQNNRMETFTIDPMDSILLGIIGGLLLIQALYFVCLYLRIPRHKKAVEQGRETFNTDCPPLSVILYANDAYEDIEANLTALLEQDYPQFEVIVITDGKEDSTSDGLKRLQQTYPHLYHSFIPDSSRYISRKKLALTLGIKAAKYDWLVMTEADCRPRTNQWLRLLARNFTPGTEVVLGYCGYERGKGWLHKRVAYDRLFLSMRYLGFAFRHPYMGLGRNFAYRKKAFYQNKGFSGHLNLLRGDDDLFVNQAATSDNTRVETDADAVVQQSQPTRRKEWCEEKIGYASTARFYRGWQRYALGWETCTRLLFHAAWIGTLTWSIQQKHWLVAGIAFLAFAIRYLLQIYAVNQNAKALREPRRYYLTLPVFDILQPLQSLRWKLYCTVRRKSEFMRK